MKAKRCPECFGDLNLTNISKYNGKSEPHRRINVAYYCLGYKTIFLNPMFTSYEIIYSKILFKNQSESSDVKNTTLEKIEPITVM